MLTVKTYKCINISGGSRSVESEQRVWSLLLQTESDSAVLMLVRSSFLH